MDFVFDRSADTQVIKNLAIVDDVTHESALIRTERTISGLAIALILDELAVTRGLPRAILHRPPTRCSWQKYQLQ